MANLKGFYDVGIVMCPKCNKEIADTRITVEGHLSLHCRQKEMSLAEKHQALKDLGHWRENNVETR